MKALYIVFELCLLLLAELESVELSFYDIEESCALFSTLAKNAIELVEFAKKEVKRIERNVSLQNVHRAIH